MAGGKETPRQKMIGMMYLVLTALLALNVSKEILQSFVVINENLGITNANFEGNNETTYTAFDKAKLNDPVKVLPYWQKAQDVKALANDLDNYIDELKKRIIAKTDGMDYENPPEGADADTTFLLKKANSKDNYDIPTEILIGSEPGNPKEGPWTAKELGSKITEYETNLKTKLREVSPELEASVKLGLALSEVPKPEGGFESWENGNFFHLPLAAVITNLTKMQSDVRNAEAEVIKALLGQISADDFKFDALVAKVIPKSNYIILGDTYKADVLVAAISTTQDPVLEAGTELDSNGLTGPSDTAGISYGGGMAHYRMVPKAEGPVEWGGVIKIKKPNGDYQPFPFRSEFIAAKPTLVVSPTAMNVFYRGLENPIEVSVPGISTDKLQVSITNVVGKSGSGGNFKVKPGKGKDCIVSVSAEISGKNQNFGKKEFRVKNVPDPKPYFAGATGTSNIARKNLLAAQGVIAKMENFEFDLKFDIVSYVMSATVKGKVVEQPARGPRITANMKTLIQALRPGQKLYIEKIKAKGPDGTVRDLGTIVLKVI